MKKQKNYNNLKKNNQRKKIINILKERLSYFKSKHIKNIKGLYLEAPQLLFTKEIEKNSLNDNVEFYIPNPFDFDKFNKGRENEEGYTIKYNNRIIHNIFLKDLDYYNFVNTTKLKFAFIYADYCRTFTAHKKDIELTFKKNILLDKSILILTFAIRDVSLERANSENSEVSAPSAVPDYVKDMAILYGYYAKTIYSECYTQGMYSWAFYICKNNKDIKRTIKENRNGN
jgi:hypothetical protein